MKHIDYVPKTPEQIAGLVRITGAKVQEYMQICYKVGQSIEPRNILKLPKILSKPNHPYTFLWHWLELTNFEIGGSPITEKDKQRLKIYNSLPMRTLCEEVGDSTSLTDFENEYLQNFSQLYMANELFNSLQIYNFLIENYIYETAKARRAIQEDYNERQIFWQKLPRIAFDNCPIKNTYNMWVRQPFIKTAINHGSAYFAQVLSYITGDGYQHCHPFINRQRLIDLAETLDKNIELTQQLQLYRYYKWFEPTLEETALIHEMRNSSDPLRNTFLLSRGQEYLSHAAKLAGDINHPITEIF